MRKFGYSRFVWRATLLLSFVAWWPLRAQQPPTITTQPQSQPGPAGTNVTLSVTASGHKPLSYQWRFNASPVPDATNSVLTLINVQCLNQGVYSVVVTNPFGS